MTVRRIPLLVLCALIAASALPLACRLMGSGAVDAKVANAVCYECHIDFQGEELVREHERHQVACVRCHGPSQAHMEDEVRKTKPDFIARGKAMTIFCLTCHSPAKHARVGDHADEARKPADQRRTCTQCHGDHKLVEVEDIKPK